MTYDTFSTDYDRFVSWPGRLAVEMPFIESQLRPLADQNGSLPRVLDAACGTGMHAIALAQLGYPAAGADLSAGMIEHARTNAAEAGVQVMFKTAGFGSLAQAFSVGEGEDQSQAAPFDTLLCLGNSLPHALTESDLAAALADFAACLSSGGLLIIQNRNFDAVMVQGERWMEPQAYREGEKDWLFLRFYDFEKDGMLTFNILTLKRTGQGDWKQEITTTRLRPLRQVDVMGPLVDAGFQDVKFYGNMGGAPFDPAASSNLVITANKK
jgi:glycine/sarcosine N-methyltransferase